MAITKQIFHDSVPATERMVLEVSDLYRLSLRVATQSDLLVSKVDQTSAGTAATFMRGFYPVLKITKEKDVYYAATFDSPHLNSVTTIADSKNPMYLLKALYKSVKGSANFISTIRETDDATMGMLRSLTSSNFYHFTEKRDIYMNYSRYLDNDLMGPLVEVFFGERNAVDMPTKLQEVMSAIRSERDKCRAAAADVARRMREIFAANKWFVTHLPGHGYTVQQVALSGGDIGSRGDALVCNDLTPVMFYRKLDDMPVDIRDQLLGTLTLAKMHMQRKYPTIQYEAEPHDMVPFTKHVTCEELGAVVSSYYGRRVILITV